MSTGNWSLASMLMMALAREVMEEDREGGGYKRRGRWKRTGEDRKRCRRFLPASVRSWGVTSRPSQQSWEMRYGIVIREV